MEPDRDADASAPQTPEAAAPEPYDADMYEPQPTDGGGGGAVGQETACNRLDDDHNGLADDVDLDHDGICDCLAVATMGAAGSVNVSSVFQDWLKKRAHSGAVALDRKQFDAATLAKYQVLVLQNLTSLDSFDAEETKLLETWVKRGGGVLALGGYDLHPLTNANQLLQPFGVEFSSQIVLFDLNVFDAPPISNWHNPHPVTDGIKEVGWNTGNPVLGGAALAFDDAAHTSDLMSAVVAGEGHVLVWGDEWITYDNQWSNHPDYQVERLWANMLKWLTKSTECQVPVPPLLL